MENAECILCLMKFVPEDMEAVCAQHVDRSGLVGKIKSLMNKILLFCGLFQFRFNSS